MVAHMDSTSVRSTGAPLKSTFPQIPHILLL
jgi:hypothetical protein